MITNETSSISRNSRQMPALFVGHGSPMNAIEETRWSQAWQNLGRHLPTPSAILVISAHWVTPGICVTAMPAPRTIHDFGGFPEALYAAQYPAVGNPTLARRVQELLAPAPVKLDLSWGLDHGAWSILMHMYPDANIPTLQLSLDQSLSAEAHYKIGRQLRSLRDEGVLILASGNVVHNLGLIQWHAKDSAPAWAERIEQKVMDSLIEGNHAALIDYLQLDPQAALAIPTSEHYLPLLYIAGLINGDPVEFPIQGIDLGTISMLSVRAG